MKTHISIGKISKTHGLKGHFIIYGITHNHYQKIIIKDQDFLVEKITFHKNYGIIKLKAFQSIEDITPYLGEEAFIHREEISLQDNEYLISDLIGLPVYIQSPDKTLWGHITGVFEYGAQPCIRIKSIHENKEIEYPFLDKFIISLDSSECILENNEFFD